MNQSRDHKPRRHRAALGYHRHWYRPRPAPPSPSKASCGCNALTGGRQEASSIRRLTAHMPTHTTVCRIGRHPKWSSRYQSKRLRTRCHGLARLAAAGFRARYPTSGDMMPRRRPAVPHLLRDHHPRRALPGPSRRLARFPALPGVNQLGLATGQPWGRRLRHRCGFCRRSWQPHPRWSTPCPSMPMR